MNPAILIVSSLIMMVVIGIVVYYYFMMSPMEEEGSEEATISKTPTSPESCTTGQAWNEELQTCQRKYYPCQYIKVTNGHGEEGPNLLNFAQLVAYDELGNDVALNKSTKQSHLYNDTDRSPDAVDGNDKTFMHTATRNVGQWWQVDLGSEMNITKIHFVHRKQCCQDRDGKAVIQLLASDGTTEVHRVVVPEIESKSNMDITERTIVFNFDETVPEEDEAEVESFMNVYSNYGLM